MYKSIKAILLVLAVSLVLVTMYIKLGEFSATLSSEEGGANFFEDMGDGGGPFTSSDCSVAGVAFQGDLYTYYDPDTAAENNAASSENIAYYLEAAEEAPNIKAILLEIDSYGGYPVAAEELVMTLEKSITKPVIAQIREGGVSAAYWVAAATDVIFASALSDVGGIGVTASYVDESVLNKREGYTFNELATGKFKDAGNPQKPLTSEERALFERDIAIIHDAFVASVAKHRGLDVATVHILADGATMLGQMAKEKGLIDEIGGLHEIEAYVEDTYDFKPEICWE